MATVLSFNKLLRIAAIGGGLEMYDFVIYMSLVPIIGPIFFASSSAFMSMMIAFSVFALGYFIRPLGGIVMGHFGDRIGRKKTFIASILLMSIPVLLIGLLPTPAQMGELATFLFILLRLIQGLAVGAEIPGSMTFIAEHAPPHRRGFASGFIYCGLNLGISGALLFFVALSSVLSRAQMDQFGWRIPFILGALLGLIAFYLRRSSQESPAFLSLSQHHQIKKVPIVDVLQKKALILRGVGVTALGATLITLASTYQSAYLIGIVGFNHSIIWLVVVATFISACIQPYCGGWSDRMGRVKMLRVAALATLILAYPIFFLLSLHQWLSAILAFGLLIILMGLIIGIYPAILVELFPTALRYSGYALVYNIGFALFAGLSPLVATYLIHHFHLVTAPAICLMVSSVLCLLGLMGLPDHYDAVL